MNLKNFLVIALSTVQICCLTLSATAQSCTSYAPVQLSPQPNNCTTAQSGGNIINYFNHCGDICTNNTGAGPSNEVQNHKCTGNVQPANDLYLYANNPYAHLTNYDGSLVFRWVTWPNQNATPPVPPPYFAVHGNVSASLAGINVKSISCTGSPAFALENAICVDTPLGNQFYAPAGTIPTLAQLTPLVRQIAGVAVNVDDVSFWINIATQDGATGPICFQLSPYKSGYLCGDPNSIILNGTGSTRTGSAPSDCLCNTALYGGLAEPANAGLNLPLACGQESPSSAWYKIVAPFGCNKITASLGAWGGQDSYNIEIVSGVNCPGKSGTNPITGAATFLPGQQLQSGAKVVGSGCGAPAVTACSPVPAGEYYIVVSGKTERPTFQLNVQVDDVSPTVGTATLVSPHDSICSGSSVVVGTTGTILPLNATCGQNIAWYYSSTLSFNPYNGQGTYATSGTSNDTIQLPANTTCQPKTYYIKGVIADSGRAAVAGCKGTTNAIAVTVYPEIGTPTVNNSQCLISVAARCSNFTVNGRPGVSNFIATFPDNGTTRNFIISNGLAACNQTVQQVVSCSGNCTQPTGSGVAICDSLDPYNFYVNVTFAPGSASSYFIKDNLGGSFALAAAGTYKVGPYADNSTVSLTITNPSDSACNLPLGSFIKDCNSVHCPNLVSATTNLTGAATTVCEGAQTVLQATVDQGVLNQDYSLQWYNNGVAIPGATNTTYINTFTASQGCSPETQTFTVNITCLRRGASASTTSTLTAGTVTVYPRPHIGRDFVQDTISCHVAPLDYCGGLNIVYTPTTNLNPGATATQVNYTVSVSGAPNGCTATGYYTVNCPATGACNTSAGNGVQSHAGTYCYGQQFQIGADGNSANFGTGYTQAWAVTSSNPYTNLNAAVSNAITNNTIFGPDNSGNNVYTYINGIDYQPGDYYFIPFAVMQSISNTSAAYSTSGTLNAPFGQSSVSKVITIPQLPYCSGTTNFKLHFYAHQTSGVGNPIDNVTGIMTYNSGSTTSVTLDNNNYAGNPSGQSITLSASSFFGANVDYTFSVTYVNSVTYPFVCPTCNSVGTPIHVTLLPQVTLAPIPAQSICQNTSFNLTTLNPSASVLGTYTWYSGNPNSGGQVVPDPTNVTPTNTQQFYIKFLPAADTLCYALDSVSFSIPTPPFLNTIPAQAPICFGVPVDLTALNASATAAHGTFVWYKGNPDSSGVRLPNAFATNLLPIDGQKYYLVFTDSLTGCSNKTSVSYTVKPLPSLNGVPTQNVCTGSTFNLIGLQPSITPAPSTFAWYNGNPTAGGTLLTTNQASSISPTNNSVYYVVVTDSVTGCSANTNVHFNVNALPTLITPNPAAACSHSAVDLTALEPNITSTAGSFAWYVGNPTAGGVAIANPQVFVLDSTTTLYVVFTNAISNCSATTSFTYTAKPSTPLNSITLQPICAGQTVSLTSYDTLLTQAQGFYNWFIGDPNNGGTQLTNGQAANQQPTGNETYYIQFLAFPSACTTTDSFKFTVNPSTALNPVQVPASLCANTPVNLTSLNASATTASGTFAWFSGSTTGAALTGNALTAQLPTAGTKYYLVFTNSGGCKSTDTVTFNVSAPITGATASYDCVANKLVVGLSGATGGSGSGYVVSATSPDSANQVVANGASWTVVVVDGAGCGDTLRGVANCLTCSAGTAHSVDTILCCDRNDSLRATITGESLAPNKVIAWGITIHSAGPLSTAAGVNAANTAGNVFASKPDSSIALLKPCNQLSPDSTYYLTPFIANAPISIPIVWDSTAGCKPKIIIAPTITGTGWIIDSLEIIFPDGSVYNVNNHLIGGAPLTPGLLAALGGNLPNINIGNLFSGNPNGIWTVKVINGGTGSVTFNVPTFQIVVSGDSCDLLNHGPDQVTPIPGVSGTIGAGATQSINIQIPPLPTSFPTLDTACLAFGTPIQFKVERCLGIDEFGQLSNINIYPNPTESVFYIDGYLIGNANVRMTVTNVVGAEVQVIEKKMERGAFKESLDLSNVAQGVYFVTIKTDNQTITRKIVKQ